MSEHSGVPDRQFEDIIPKLPAYLRELAESAYLHMDSPAQRRSLRSALPGGSVRSQGASTLRRHKATSLVVYAAASSLISECQRVRKSRRCSVNATWAPPRRRTRKYCRSSSNALQKRDADSKLPKPCIG